MIDEPMFDRVLRDHYRRHPSPATDPGRVLPGLLAEVAVTPQRRAWRRRLRHGSPSERRRTDRMFTAITFIAATILLASLGSFYAINLPSPTDPAVVPAADASASGTAAPTPTRTPAATIEGTGPVLSWEPLSEQEQREVFAGEPPAGGPDLTFKDGSPAEWQHAGHGFRIAIQDGGLIHRWNKVPVGFRPMEIVVEKPDGTIATSTIEKPLSTGGASGSEIAISPAGILVGTNFRLSDRDLVKLIIGRESVGRWLERGKKDRSPCCRVTDDGVVRIASGFQGLPAGNYRPEAIADKLRAIGLTPEDLRAYMHGFGHAGVWFSADGVSWRRVDDAWPGSVRLPNLLASDDGFYVPWRRNLYFSPDADEWETVPGPVSADSVWEWKGRLYGIDEREDGRLQLSRIEPSGAVELPIPALTTPVIPSGLGLFGYDHQDRLIFFSPDGEVWSLSPAPADWGLGDDEYYEVVTQGQEINMIRDPKNGPSFRAVLQAPSVE